MIFMLWYSNEYAAIDTVFFIEIRKCLRNKFNRYSYESERNFVKHIFLRKFRTANYSIVSMAYFRIRNLILISEETE
jgi:hypothetical protein